jgi:hypothetical protein
VPRMLESLAPCATGAGALGAAGVREGLRRVVEAARDAHHRLRTGRPRGVPIKFVHPPLECSRGSSQAARRVHGLLYGYSLAYAEVRPKAETIALALGYGRSTVHNALAELRRAGLLTVHERHGLDGRRIANRYEVLTPAWQGLPDTRPTRSEVRNSPPEPQKTRTRIGISQSSKGETTTTGVGRPRSAHRPHIELVRSPAQRSSSISEESLGQAIGSDRLGQLRARFGEDLTKLRLVMGEQNALEHPALLRTACDAMTKHHGSIDNPAAYLVGILRHQQQELEGARQELLELEERHRQARAFDDPNAQELELRIAKLREDIATPSATPAAPETPPVVRPQPMPPAAPAVARRRTLGMDSPVATSQRSREGDPERIEDTVLRLKRSSPALAKIFAEQLGPDVPAEPCAEPGKASAT